MFRDWLYERFSEVKKLPNFLVPKYFNIVLMTAYHSAKEYCLSQMPEFVANGSQFVKQLALTSVQMYGSVPSTGLDVASRKASLAAGLPHFSTFHMRCWGRDVFIALRGLLLITGQFSAAKDHLLAFGGCELHGLIPNLLDSCRKPRFNARDAVWWYLQALQDYCQLAPDGLKLLQTKIKRRFPNDEYIDYQDPRAFGAEWTIAELVQHIMQQHANGIEFREWNAGSNLDHAMDSKGFDVRVRLDLETGFLHGGSQWNCGTWMDKMGDSSKAGNWGKPATPRDGAAIEIIGLLKSTLRWLTGLAEKGQFPTGVTIEGKKITLSYADWDKLVLSSFEKKFYIPLDKVQDSLFELNPTLVSRRGMYKDTVDSSLEFADYQLRPNFALAMVFAPELFSLDRAKAALDLGKEVLLGPLGIKTLDSQDWSYRGDYDNANDSSDATMAHGFNYHQGPEWLWIAGIFLKALFEFQLRYNSKEIRPCIHFIRKRLQEHRKHILEESNYAGLPELTNSNGSACHDSCPSQAWSSAAMLDLVHTLATRKQI